MESRYLYRGKRIDNREWVEGFLFMVNDVPYILPHHKTGQPIHADNLLKTVVEVLEDTICQCTGLKDKNGNLIWENDMVKGAYFVNGKEHRFIGKVGYVGSAFKVVGVKQYSGMRQELHSVYAIIGNIFDNPELLE